MLGEGGELSDARPVLVVADDPAAAALLERVIRAMPDLLAVRSDWRHASAAVAERARLAAVLVDCAGIEDAALARALPVLMAAAELAPAPLIVGFTAVQLEAVAAELLGGETVLLCDPDPLNWAAELALATPGEGLTVREAAHEDERYRRLSGEVARIAATLAQLIEPDRAKEQESKGDGFVAEPPRGYGAKTGEPDAAEIRRAIRARRLRDEMFAQAGLFEDPAWDMLLDLFAAELERRPVSVSSLCIAAAVPATTALRWISKLIAADLLERRPDSLDRRRAFISLSAKASAGMRAYIAALRRAGLKLS